ncbi:MAG: AAA family ATPase, partial [Candidatus Omnitrophica bacterium]|nr:AAA family ATPase [Candidatus Omnitrophota bacterium]
MLIDNVQINTTIVKRFSILNQKNRLAHAYLFSGPAYSGKSETALAIAQLINCENNEDGSLDNACQTCPACKKTMAGNHPDVHFFQTEYGETIKVETARAILESIQLRPFEARKKIFILRNAENLTLEGANALLKTLEEPSLNSLLILTTSQPEKILGTIRSRCHSVHFCSTSSETVKDQLEKLYDISADDSHFLSY